MVVTRARQPTMLVDAGTAEKGSAPEHSPRPGKYTRAGSHYDASQLSNVYILQDLLPMNKHLQLLRVCIATRSVYTDSKLSGTYRSTQAE